MHQLFVKPLQAMFDFAETTSQGPPAYLQRLKIEDEIEDSIWDRFVPSLILDSRSSNLHLNSRILDLRSSGVDQATRCEQSAVGAFKPSGRLGK